MTTTAQISQDHEAIRKTIETIAGGADRRDWDAVQGAFAARVVLDYGTPELLTAGDIVGRWRPLLSAFDTTQHVIDQLDIAVEGNLARASSRFQATHHLSGAAGGEIWVLAGRYEHELVRTSTGGWAVTRMRMIPEQSTGNQKLLDLARERAGLPAPPRQPENAAAASAGNTPPDARARNRATVHAFFERLEAFDIQGFVRLFAKDGVQTMPFSPEGFPRRLAGQDAIFQQYRSMPDNFVSMRFPDLVVQDLADPERFFVTYRGEIKLRSGGVYNNTYAALFIVRNGLIIEFQEYFDPIVLQRAFGAKLGDSFNVGR